MNDPVLTKNQKLVRDVLSKALMPLSAYAILDLLREDGLRAPLQVYRALEKLQMLGLVHKIESLNAFVTCSRPDCAQHKDMAFAICNSCGSVTEFADINVNRRLENMVSDTGFERSQTTIEIRGMCISCSEI